MLSFENFHFVIVAHGHLGHWFEVLKKTELFLLTTVSNAVILLEEAKVKTSFL